MWCRYSRARSIRRCTGWRIEDCSQPTRKQTHTGREAKFYRLTKKGRTQLEEETASWRRLAEAVGLILKLSEGGAE